MALRRAFAALAVASLAVGGLMITTATANAASTIVTAGDILMPDSAGESAAYNSWHYDPSFTQYATQGTTGLVFQANTDAVVVDGNGNDALPETTSPALTVEATIASLAIDISADANTVFYQVPVFFDKVGSSWKFTTLRKDVTDNSDNWISSRALTNVPAQTATPLATIMADLRNGTTIEPRTIATGFFVDSGANSVIVHSFSAEGNSAFFAPSVTSCAAPAASSNFVDADSIRPNEATYPGWHNGLTTTATEKNFVTTTAGLEVTGNAQILNGLQDPAEFQANCLGAAATMMVDVADSTASVATQVPIFYYPNGVSSTVPADRLFTTIRLADTEMLGDPAALWTTSGAIYADAAKTTVLFAAGDSTTLAAFVAAVGVHDVIGYGFYVDIDQSATVRSVMFNNQTTTFAVAGPVDPTQPVTPIKPVKPVKVDTGVSGF